MKTSTFKTEVLHLLRNLIQGSLQVGELSLKQVVKFKYHGIAFTSHGRQDEELNVRSGKANAVMRTMHHSAVLKQELSKKAKLWCLSRYSSASSPMVMNLGNRPKSAVTNASVRNEIFAKNQKSYYV